MALSQSHYRFGIAELAESTHGWHGNEDAPVAFDRGSPFLLRVCVQNDASGAANNIGLQFQYRLKRYKLSFGAWTNITTNSAVVRTGSTTVFTNGQNCTKRLSGTGTFESSGAGCTHDGTSGGTANDIAASGNSETEIGLQVLANAVGMGDELEFRVVLSDGTPLGAYEQTPLLTVNAKTRQLAAVQSRGPATGENRLEITNTLPDPPDVLRFDLPMTNVTRDDGATAFSAGLDYEESPGVWVPSGGLTFVGGTTHPKTGLPREAWFEVERSDSQGNRVPLPAGTYRAWLDLPTALDGIGAVVSW